MLAHLPATEKANVLTHALGLVLGLVLLPLLCVRGAWAWDLLLFGFTFLLMFSASSIYHLQTKERPKFIWRKIDHISIFLLIAGTYTPFLVRYMMQDGGQWLLIVLWSSAVAGTVMKVFYAGRFKIVSTGIYLLMGWVALFSIKDFLVNIPGAVLIWIGVGGVFYTLGTVFYLWKRLIHHHAIWHLFVLGGALSHLIAVYLSTSP